MFTSTLTVTSAAKDLTLLSLAELRDAVGVSGSDGQDEKLKRLNLAVAAAITRECHVRAGGAKPPTLRQEDLSEEFRVPYTRLRKPHSPSVLTLSRRPIVTVASVTEIGVALTTGDYRIDAAAGEIVRMSMGEDCAWARGTITVVYTAGWATVPDGLKAAASKLARDWWAQQSRDPLLRSKDIAGVGSFTYWVGAMTDASVPQDVLDELAPYRELLA